MRFRNLAIILSLAANVMFIDAANAQSLDINLSNTSAQFKYGTRLGNAGDGRSEMSVGFLYNDDDNYMAEAGLLIVDFAGSRTPGLELGIGPKLYIASHSDANSNAVAIGLGGQMRYKTMQLSRVNFTVAGYIAPSIVSFADANHMWEFNAQVGYEILPTADVYFGYRQIRVNFDPQGTHNIDQTWMVGMKFSY